MSHNRDHIIIHSLVAPVTFSEEAKPKWLKVWHLAVACALVGFLLGLVF